MIMGSCNTDFEGLPLNWDASKVSQCLVSRALEVGFYNDIKSFFNYIVGF